MRPVIALLAIVAGLSFASMSPTSAQDMHEDGCSHDATFAALRACVQHAAEHGHVDNAGIVQALLAKIDAASRALDTGNNARAVKKLDVFVALVDAQTGKHIDAEHSAHLRLHAIVVIAALSS